MTTNNQWLQSPEFKIKLRRAVLNARPIVYQWMAASNLTKSMLGEPDFPDAPVPSYNEFIEDFSDGFFTDDCTSVGKCFIIANENSEVGTVCYDLLNLQEKRAVLDIWLSDEKYCGKGYGSQALRLLCGYLYTTLDINKFYIAPSLRNARAIKSYEKAGFKRLPMNRTEAANRFGIDIFDYDDNVVMEKILVRPQL